MNKQVSSMRVRGIVLIWILLTFSVGIIQSTSHILSANQAHDSSESISEAKINNQVEEVLSTQFFENLGQVLHLRV
jgi:hypothetical protein